MELHRLETTYETRQTGWGFDDYGRPTPVRTTYHIGHGQQLARQRLNDRLTQVGVAVEPTTDSRQVRRASDRKDEKAIARDADRQARADALAAFRANPGVVSSRKYAAGRAAHRKAANAAKANNRPFKHLHRSARLRAEAAWVAEIQEEIRAGDARPKRAKKAAA